MQDRVLLAANARLRVERVRAHAAPAEWSPVYRAPSRRLVLPGSGAVEFRGARNSLLVDGLTAFRVDAAMAYRLKPEPLAAGGERLSVVVSDAVNAAHTDDDGHDEVRRASPAFKAWMLSPAALYRLRLQWRLLERGEVSIEATDLFIAREFRIASPTSGDEEPAIVRRARRFLVAQPGTARTLHDVADAAHSSAFHLARQFRRSMGLSLHQYRQRLRLAGALAALEAGERDLAGLAHDLGFCSHSHFGAVFRREVGTSPMQARAMLHR
jgi:AraC-like DNA-binding protein